LRRQTGHFEGDHCTKNTFTLAAQYIVSPGHFAVQSIEVPFSWVRTQRKPYFVKKTRLRMVKPSADAGAHAQLANHHVAPDTFETPHLGHPSGRNNEIVRKSLLISAPLNVGNRDTVFRALYGFNRAIN
jgi:hypothetical protein